MENERSPTLFRNYISFLAAVIVIAAAAPAFQSMHWNFMRGRIRND